MYNWQSASTPQGRERLKELVDQGYEIATRRSAENIDKNIITHTGLDQHSGDVVIDNDRYEDWEDAEENNAFFSLEFLDPDPQPATVDDIGWQKMGAQEFREDDEVLICTPQGITYHCRIQTEDTLENPIFISVRTDSYENQDEFRRKDIAYFLRCNAPIPFDADYFTKKRA